MGSALAVIGGTGFIGRAVADAATEAGYEPVLLAPAAPDGAQAHAPDAPVVDCDIVNPESVLAALRAVEPVAIAHLAAFGVGRRGLLAGAEDDPRRAVAVNVGGFVNVVESAAAVGVDRVVWASSTTVYGPPQRYEREPVDELAALAPETTYGATKAAAELLAPSLEAQTGVRPVALRLPLVHGPGRWYGGSQEGLVAFVTDVAAGRAARLEASEDPADWIYITDAAAAFMAAFKAPDPYVAYNLLGHRGSLADVGRAIAAHANAAAEVVIHPGRGLALPAVDDRAARRDLGFAPRFDLSTAAADYVARVKPTRVLDADSH